MNLDSLLLCLLHDIWDGGGTLFVEEGGADLRSVEHFVKGESHSTTNNHLVDNVEHVVDELDLVLDLGTTHNNGQWTVGTLEDFREILKLLLQ